MKYEIDSENILKAHKEGCSDVKKVLENIAPELFKEKFPKLMMNGDTGLVIIAEAINPLDCSRLVGRVIKGGTEPFRLNYCCDTWLRGRFHDINGLKVIE